MAERTVVCAVAGREWSHNGSFTADYETGTGYAGYDSVRYYVYILKFTTPRFAGRSESLTFGLPVLKLTGETVVLRYALCSSDANSGSYAYAYGAVEDDTQIAAGTWTLEGLTAAETEKSLTISAKELQSGKEYYMYLWAADDYSGNTGGCIQLGDTGSIGITMVYTAGTVQIQTAEGIKTAYVDVYQGGKWHENCIPEVYLDGTWKTCS